MKQSTIRKIAMQSMTRSGNKALQTKPVMSLARQQQFLKETVTKRIIASSTTRALDMLKIHSVKKRAAIQLAMQEFQKAMGNTELERIALKKALKQMTGKEFDAFIGSLSQIRDKNANHVNAFIELRLKKAAEAMKKPARKRMH